MHLRQLDLEEFRLYRRLSLTFDPAGLGISGDNASGKSTLVEAIALLATMRSPRSGSDRELINWRSGEELGFPPYARVIGAIDRRDGAATVEIGMQLEAVDGRVSRKAIKVNGSPTRAIDAVGTVKVVLFAPEDVALAAGAPVHRRRYLDLMISQIDRAYVRALSRYNRVLEQRNSLLRQLGKEAGTPNGAAAAQLGFWDAELVAHGSRIVARRIWATTELDRLGLDRFEPFGKGQRLSLVYRPSLGDDVLRGAGGAIDQTTAEMKVATLFTAQIEERRREELRRGVSLVGPHRDDFTLLLEGIEVGVYGSRGQQRLAVVAIKLAEADVMAEAAEDAPLVLLDDVLSELDADNRKLLLAGLAASGNQVIVTAADPHLLQDTALEALPRATVTAGVVDAGRDVIA